MAAVLGLTSTAVLWLAGRRWWSASYAPHKVEEKKLTIPEPSPASVFECLDGFRKSKALFTAVSLGLFDALGTGEASLQSLCEQLRTSEDGLERLLDANVALGHLEKVMSPSGAFYRNSPVARVYLVSSSPLSLAGYVRHSDRLLLPLWMNLENSVRTGWHSLQVTFGGDAGEIFERLYKSDTDREQFLRAMHSFLLLVGPKLAGAFDLRSFRVACDLGGGSGQLAVSILEQFPHMKATLFDRADATSQVQRLGLCRPSARLSIVAGDFFVDDLPAGVDLFCLSRILHDWTADKIQQLLVKVYRALPVGGAVLIAETVTNELHTGPLYSTLQSLNMLVQTEGRERSFADYEVLLARAGFVRASLARTGMVLDAILAFKA